ncbi:BA75_02630T0 [Komagataella pastoris]|uniref:BA75_02630T0 n=1 Tax=Komagataella pastoris TaxID=4922 RepID=A0A1B2JD90_PICPA|nr:BA75_02630T0 [Komagataella pastoris]
MSYLKISALLSVLSVVLADQRISITVVGEGINSGLRSGESHFEAGPNAAGSPLDLILHEPSGFLVDAADASKYVGWDVAAGTSLTFLPQDQGAKDWGIVAGNLRFNVGGTQFYACETKTGVWEVKSYEATGCKAVVLSVASHPVPSSSSSSSSSSHAPTSSTSASSSHVSPTTTQPPHTTTSHSNHTSTTLTTSSSSNHSNHTITPIPTGAAMGVSSNYGLLVAAGVAAAALL